ncbi:diacylglycerol kinase family protein [Parabacteroides sp. AM08-6]|uniref:diacylglycerol kinase family protein n=1 Tax=Parabacteroides sp. AM08-6 TaxID=2292053 RepID=UPI000EFEFA69|nr:diacylglycerol kinase family protein [Parabacteroides sp. AM08-6]RHJ81810.1 diacylglycerol kinase family protein [Parabacteroides sp. AM08-6]
MKNRGFTFRKRLASFRYAFNGIRLLIKNEYNAWIHSFAAICVIIAGFFFSLSSTEWIAVIIAIGTVFSAEAINSAIEAISDLVSPEYNEAIKKAKDLAAGAVLITAIAAAAVGFIIFLPKLTYFIENLK